MIYTLRPGLHDSKSLSPVIAVLYILGGISRRRPARPLATMLLFLKAYQLAYHPGRLRHRTLPLAPRRRARHGRLSRLSATLTAIVCRALELGDAVPDLGSLLRRPPPRTPPPAAVGRGRGICVRHAGRGAGEEVR